MATPKKPAPSSKPKETEAQRRSRERERMDNGSVLSRATRHSRAAQTADATKEYARVRTMNGNPVPRTLGGSANPGKRKK